jgi:hypothetical protein
MTQISTRNSRNSPLEDQILEAFKRALSEEQSEAAEHLLRALEVLQPDPMPTSSVAKAYRAIADRTINGSTAPRRLGTPRR